MRDVLGPFLAVLAIYVAAVILVGVLASRRSGRSADEYFLAGRGLGTSVLFMALFGTNCTAFVLVGIPALAYRDGIGTFGLNAPIVALGIPLSFWAIGVPARRLALELGALTPAELYAKRLGSRAVGVTMFAIFTLYTVPYMVTAVDGAAGTLAAVTDGAVSAPIGAALVLLVALAYTAMGGMRATAWTNVLQGAVFLGFMALAFFAMASSLGGWTASLERVREVAPQHLSAGKGGLFEPRAFASWSLAISATVIAFPHMLVRLFTARDEETLRRISRLYPLALAALWIPAVMIGVWAAAEFPGLEGRARDGVFASMVVRHLPPAGAALGFLAVLAAVMSTLDAQLLTLGSMLTRDVLSPRSPKRQVLMGRTFGGVVAVLVYLLWLVSDETIFGLASVAFSGYVTLAPLLFLGVRWKRLTAAGALASMVAGSLVYFIALGNPFAPGAALTPSWGGFLPVVWGFVAAVAGAVLGTLMGPGATKA